MIQVRYHVLSSLKMTTSDGEGVFSELWWLLDKAWCRLPTPRSLEVTPLHRVPGKQCPAVLAVNTAASSGFEFDWGG